MNEKEKEAKAARMGEESVPKLILSFSLSTFAALLFNSLYTLTDALFVSHAVGNNAMGGVSLVLPFVVLQSAIASAVGSGGASLVSRALGEGDFKKAGNGTYNAMALFYSSAVIITHVGLLTREPVLHFLGVTSELYEPAKQYYTILLFGNVFSTGFSSIIRAEGKMKYALLIWVIPVSVNIALDALFVLVLGLGVVGSAAATVACQVTSAFMSVLFFKKFSCQDFEGRFLSKDLFLKIFLVGFPSVVQMGSLSLLTLLVNKSLGSVAGTEGVNAFAYIGRIMTLAFVPFTALSQSLYPVAGFNYGAKKPERVKKAFLFSSSLGFFSAVVLTLCLFFFSDFLIGIFVPSGADISLASGGLKAVSFSLLFSFLTPFCACLFQSEGKRLVPLLLYFVTPASAVVLMNIFSGSFGISGVWAAYDLSAAISWLFSLFVLVFERRKAERRCVRS